MFNSFMISNYLNFAVKFILIIVIVLSILLLLDLISENKKRKQLLNGVVQTSVKQSFIKRMKFFKQYYINIELLLNEKKKANYIDLAFYGSIGVLVFLMIYFISIKQILLAIISPILLAKGFNMIAKMLISNVIDDIEQQLPFAIDNIIRVSSKYEDLRTIIFEASKTLESPLKNILEQLSRKMISGDVEEVLMDFAREYDNVWIYSLVFTLISYVQNANKQDTIKNLKHLRTMLEKDNNLKRANITDKKYGVTVNYTLSILAVVFGVGNIMINPYGKKFFFGSFVGIICFILGFVAVFFTIIINIKMSKNKNKK